MTNGTEYTMQVWESEPINIILIINSKQVARVRYATEVTKIAPIRFAIESSNQYLD